MGKNEQLSEFELYRRRVEAKKRMGSLGWILGISAAAVVGVMIFINISHGSIGETFRKKADNSLFPVEVAGGTVRQMEELNWDVALCGDTELSVYSQKGGQSLDFLHGMATPIMKTSGGRGLVYDQGGDRFELFSSSKRLYSGNVSGGIHAASVAADGTAAIAYSKSQSVTEVLVYDSGYRQIGAAWSTQSLVSVAQLSPDGRQTAVACLSAKGGGALTTIYLLDVNNSKELFKLEIPDEIIYDISFKRNGLHVITDRSVKLIDTAGRVRGSFDYSGMQLIRYSSAVDAGTVIMLGNHRYLRESDIVVLDNTIKERARVRTQDTITGLCANISGFSYLTGGVVKSYSLDGDKKYDIPAPDTIKFLQNTQDIYAVTYEELRKINIT